MPSLLIVLCVLCETPSASVLSKSAVQNPCCMPYCLFFPFSPHFVGQFKPSVGSQAPAVCGVTHMDENSHLLLTLLGRDRGEIMTGKEMRTTRIPVLQFLGHFIGPVLLLLLFTWGSETAPQKGGAVEFGNGSVGMAGNMDSWISPLFV